MTGLIFCCVNGIIYTSGFLKWWYMYQSHWVSHSFGLVPHQSKELCKLLYVSMLVCKSSAATTWQISSFSLFLFQWSYQPNPIFPPRGSGSLIMYGMILKENKS